MRLGRIAAGVLLLTGTLTSAFIPGPGSSGTSLNPYTGAVSISGNRTNGSDSIANVNVNGQINVQTYGAKGDCSTDDHNAIQAAMDYAYTHGQAQGNNAGSLTVYFPPPSAGCYLTSTLTWEGVSLIGSAGAGNQQISGNNSVQIRGKPGQDIFAQPDPTVAPTHTPFTAFSVRDLSFVVDDSTDASGTYAHPRRLGRTILNASITSGSAVLSADANAFFTPDDVGQPIQVIGASSATCAPLAGANCLNTTISSVVQPVKTGTSITQVNLAASATATVSSGSAYVSVDSIPVSQTVGNCAFAFPGYDGNTADWAAGHAANFFGGEFRDVSIQGLIAGNGTPQNSSCGWFFQGGIFPDSSSFQNISIRGIVYGVVYGPPTTNPTSTSTSFSIGDQNVFDRIYFGTTYPWITYNGGSDKLTQVQNESAHGIQILNDFSGFTDTLGNWVIEIPEDEQRGTGGNGDRIEGFEMFAFNTRLGGEGTSLWGASDSYCRGCLTGGSGLKITGYTNDIEVGQTAGITDATGANRVFQYGFFGGPFEATLPASVVALNNLKGGIGQEHTPDFLLTGNSGSPYNNSRDLWLWPQNMGPSATTSSRTTDATSESGMTFDITGGAGGDVVDGLDGLQLKVGTQFPAGKVRVYIKAKADSAASATVNMRVNAGGTTVGTITPNWTTSYQTVSFDADLSGHSGQTVDFQLFSAASTIHIAWIMVRPWLGDVLTNGPVNSCKGNVTLAAGAGTFTNTCVTTSSYCSCRDTTTNANACTAANPAAGSVGIAGTGTDVTQVACQ